MGDDGRSNGNARAQLTLVLVNLIPLAGVQWFGWDLLSILLLYWLESLWIAVLSGARILRAEGAAALGTTLLFAFAFAALAAGHLLAIAALARALAESVPAGLDPGAIADLPLFEALASIYQGGLAWMLEDRPGLLLAAAAALVLSRLLCPMSGGDRAPAGPAISAASLMRATLFRWVVLHLAVLFGAALLALLQAPDMLPLLAALIFLKIVLELRLPEHASR